MKFSHTTAPRLALLIGVATASTLGMTGWSLGARAQSAAAPATTVPPAATPVIPPAATTTAPPELPAPGIGAKPHRSGGSRHASRGMSGYLDALHDELAITPAEEPLWSTFADEMRASAAQLGQAYRQRREQLPTMNALADMNSFIGLEQMRLDGLKKSSAAFTALYQTMPPAQQKVADTVFLSDMPGAPHHGKRAKAGG
jgi:protein CpxP